MKKPRHQSIQRTRAVACTVSAAALMLGVSQAATVGLHFQDNYCADSRYVGFPVTVTAFGIATNGWENLTAMPTGYGCDVSMSVYSLSEAINTTTSTDGLNPLPNGALNVTWSANGANFSGFAGYNNTSIAPPPNYSYGTPPPVPIPTGEWQVYSSFLRDGVNFGVGSNGGDNDEPGYMVDITGLKSVFTNSSFVIELIASSDSMQELTNAFIIDATANVTNSSVAYTNTPPVTDAGAAPWVRGHGGGISTVSGVLNTDHVQIMGNRAAHGGSGPGFDNASTISGFIVTDKPVVTMSPQSVLVGPYDNVTLRAVAIGVPPLSLQWRNNGAPIPSATNLSYAVAGITKAGNFDVVVSNLYGSTTSKVASVTIDSLSVFQGPSFTKDSNPLNTPHDGAIINATLLPSYTDSNGTNRVGVAQFKGSDPDQIAIPMTDTNLDTTNGTILFWMLSSGSSNTFGGSTAAMIFDRQVINGNGLIVIQHDSSQNSSGQLEVKAGNIDVYVSAPVSDGNWHQVALAYDTTAQIQMYVDGAPDNINFGAFSWPAGQEIELGLSHNPSWEPYNGLLADVRIYDRQLTDAEIQSVYTSSAVVDANALLLWLDFTGAVVPGVTVSWPLSGDVLQSATQAQGPYTDVPLSSSPYRGVTQDTQEFFRFRHTKTNIATNPFDM